MFPRIGKKLRLASATLCLLALVFWMSLLRHAVVMPSPRSPDLWNDNYSVHGGVNLTRLPGPHGSLPELVNQTQLSLQGASATESTSSGLLARREKNRFPGIFIVGFGKSGTKALYEVLKMHPGLAGPEKEVRFFSLHYSQGFSWYLKILPDPPIGGRVIEKSPDYILTSEAASRLKDAALSFGVLPFSLKFVVMVRNPVSRAVSEYLEWKITKSSKGQKLPSFDKMVFNSAGTIQNLPFLNTSCYAEHIQKWFHYFHRNQFCFVDGDDFISQPFEQVSQLESCLGLMPFFTEKNFVYKEKRGFYCFKRHALSAEKCMNKSKGRTHPEVSTELVSRLKDFFKECNQQFYSIVGKDFGWEESDQS